MDSVAMVRDVCGGHFPLWWEWQSFPPLHKCPAAQMSRCEKPQSGKKKTTLEWWNHWNKSIAYCLHLFFHLFQSCSSNEETIWWTREGSREWFCWGSSGQLSSPDDKCCRGESCAVSSKWRSATCGLTTTWHYMHGWEHPFCWGCCCYSALSAWGNAPWSCQNWLTDKGNNNEINRKEKNPNRYKRSPSENQVINGLWAALL